MKTQEGKEMEADIIWFYGAQIQRTRLGSL